MFIPDTKNKYPYPEDTASHYAEVKMDRGIIFDKDYPYVDNSFGFKFKRFWVRFLLITMVFPWSRINLGLKISGKKNLKRFKSQLFNGAVTVSNHVHPWDYICIMKAIHGYRWPYLLSWDKNVNGDSGPVVRLVGGIPIPEHNVEATVAFNKAVKKLLEEKGVLQVYAEGSMWEYYQPIRPFKLGAASIAAQADRPILPMAFSYREPGKFRKKFLKQFALFTLNIGEPLFPNKDLPRNEQIQDLTKRAHHAVCSLAGFTNDNIYPPIYNNSKRIDK